MTHAESHLQQVCVRWFRLAHPDLALLLNAVPNGAKVSQSQARILVGEGLTKGVADLELNVARGDYHGLKIEMKTETEEWRLGKRTVTRTYQRPEQREWQKAVEAQGYKYAVVRSSGEFEALIENYLKQ